MVVERAMLVVLPEQMVCAAGVGVTFGLGFTVITTVFAWPTQLPKPAGAVAVTE